MDLQSKLLKTLIENSIKRIGSNKKIDINVRFISSTNSNILEKIESKKFREDLFHRIKRCYNQNSQP